MHTLTQVEGDTTPGGPVPSGEREHAAAQPEVGSSGLARPWWRPWALMVPAVAAGIVLVGWSYALSARGTPAGAYYLVFWVGLLVGLTPLALHLTQDRTGRTERVVTLLLLGLLTAVPKYLRNPHQPLYHDEYAHWREALDVAASGRLLPRNALIPIVQFFPGTSALTVAAERWTGLSVWSSGQLVVLAMHLASVFAVFILAEVHLRSARAGAVAATVYAVNPSALYFDTQYAYESVAMGLFLWVLACTSLAGRAASRRERVGFTVAALICSAGCVVTHHLSTVFLLTALAVVSVGSTVLAGLGRRRALRDGTPDPQLGRGRSAWWVVLGGTVVLAGLWLGLVASATISYLSPYLGGSVDQLANLAGPRGGGGRHVLADSVQPLWERLLTALAPVVVGLTALVGVRRLWAERRHWSAITSAIVLFGLVYFPSVPFILAPSGAEGARRSWGFSYVGIALLIAVVVIRIRPDGDAQPDAVPRRALVDPRRAMLRRWSRPAAFVLLAVLLIGNVGGGLNDPYRFPGPFRWGTDTNSASDEARTVARQLAQQAGPVKVVADGYTALQLVAYGGLQVAAPSAGFPAWDLTQTSTDPPADLAKMLYTSRYDYLVVDVRMAAEPAFNGANYGAGDPLAGQLTPPAFLDRLDHVPWARRVMTTEHLRVYRLDLPRLGAIVQGAS